MAPASTKPLNAEMNVSLFNTIMAARDCHTDSACARVIGVNRSTISRLRDKTCSPSGAVMLRIAKALGVPVEVLFTEVEEQS